MDEGRSHLVDNRFPKPKILKSEYVDVNMLPDDAVSTFPKTETVVLPESYHYQEGSYRPASMPVYAGYYPINVYLYRGKNMIGVHVDIVGITHSVLINVNGY